MVAGKLVDCYGIEQKPLRKMAKQTKQVAGSSVGGIIEFCSCVQNNRWHLVSRSWTAEQQRNASWFCCWHFCLCLQSIHPKQNSVTFCRRTCCCPELVQASEVKKGMNHSVCDAQARNEMRLSGDDMMSVLSV